MPVNWEGLLEHWDGRLRVAFLAAVQDIKDEADLSLIVRMLQHDDYEGALRAVGLDPALFNVFQNSFRDAYEVGGISTTSAIPVRNLERGFKVKVQFNIRNPIAEQWLRDYSANQVTELMEGQRRMIRLHLRAGMAAGENPRKVALGLVGRIGAQGRRTGGVIGLTEEQAQWVRNYASDLQNDLPNALARSLRDKRFDAAVRRSIMSGQPIPVELREKMVTAYQNRALRYRADNIARTEAMVALHQSQEAAMGIAVQSGAVALDQIAYVWRTARDKRVRDSHRSMDRQQRPATSYFVTGAGNRLRYPGDPDGPASEVINCRCWREPKIDFLAGIR